MVGMEDLDQLLQNLELLPHQQIVTDLEIHMEELKGKINRLKKELNDEKKANLMAVNKLNENLDII